MKRDFYEILGVNKNATQDEIKKAYKALAKKLHPDKNPDNTEAVSKFQELQDAFDNLSDEKKRAKYDQFGHNAPQHQGFGNQHDDLNEFLRQHGFGHFGFGNNRQSIRRGSDLTIHLKLTLEEIHTGTNQRFKYKRDDICKSCNAKGGNGEKVCNTCNGQGQVRRVMQTNIGMIQQINDCPTCEATGKLTENICNVCNGRGVVNIDEEIEISIPSGINNGATFIMEGKGAGIKNGICGKLHIIINEIPHKLFVRYGNDLKYNLKLNYSQLVLGDKVEIPTIDGKRIKIPVPEYSNVGDNLRINGKGLKILNKDDYGNLILILDIEIPKEINNEERKLLTKLMDINKKVKI